MIFRRLLPVIAAALMATPAAWSQDPAAAATPAAQTPVQPKWTGTLSFSMTLDAGEAYTRTTIAAVELDRPSPKNQLWLEFQMMHSSLKFGAVPRTTVAERDSFLATYERPISPRVSFVSQAGIEHDQIRGLDFRVANLSGIGLRIAEKSRIQYRLTPGVAITYQGKNSSKLNGGDVSGGLMHRITIPINKTMLFKHRAMVRMNVQNYHDIVADSETSLAGMVTIHFGFKLTLLYNHESLLAPPVPNQIPLTRNYVSFSPGLQYQF